VIQKPLATEKLAQRVYNTATSRRVIGVIQKPLATEKLAQRVYNTATSRRVIGVMRDTIIIVRTMTVRIALIATGRAAALALQRKLATVCATSMGDLLQWTQ